MEQRVLCKRNVLEWEKKVAADQTCAAVQDHSNNTYQDKTQYTNANTKKARFNDRLNSINKDADAEERRHKKAMLQ